MDALLKLQTLQKERQIVIQACDKGAGVIILDFDEYLKACYDHLTSEVAPGQPYYSPVNDLEVERTKAKIIELIKEGQEKEIISKTEYGEMNPDETGPGRFYCNAYKKAPPVTKTLSLKREPNVINRPGLALAVKLVTKTFILEENTVKIGADMKIL